MAVFYVGGASPNNKTTEHNFEVAALKQRLALNGRLPYARFYRNAIYGPERELRAVSLSIGRGDDQDLMKVLQEIQESFVHQVSEVNERYMSTQAINNAVELRKHTLIYFFNEGPVSLQFKAISALEWLQDDFLFVSVHEPSQALMREYYVDKLPAIRGALADEDEDEDNVKQF